MSPGSSASQEFSAPEGRWKLAVGKAHGYGVENC